MRMPLVSTMRCCASVAVILHHVLGISLLGAGKRATQMCCEEGAQLPFRISGRRLFLFEPMTERAGTGLQLREVEGMIGSRVYGHRDRRAIRP